MGMCLGGREAVEGGVVELLKRSKGLEGTAGMTVRTGEVAEGLSGVLVMSSEQRI